MAAPEGETLASEGTTAPAVASEGAVVPAVASEGATAPAVATEVAVAPAVVSEGAVAPAMADADQSWTVSADYVTGLRKDLESEIWSNHKLEGNLETMKKELSESAIVEKNLRKDADKMPAVEAQLKNVTHQAKVEARAMKILGTSLKKSEDQNKAFVEARDKILAKFRDRLQQLKSNNTAMHSRLLSSAKRDEMLVKENQALKEQLAAKTQQEGQLKEKWSNQSAKLKLQEMELVKAGAQFQNLRKRVQKLSEQAKLNEEARQAAEHAQKVAQKALAGAAAENKQLKRALPILEQEVDEAVKERDAVKGFLMAAQKQVFGVPEQIRSVFPQDMPRPSYQQEMPRTSYQQEMPPVQMPPMEMPALANVMPNWYG